MISIVGKSCSLAPHLKATAHVASSYKVVAPGVKLPKKHIYQKSPGDSATVMSHFIGKLPTRQITVCHSLSNSIQVRYGHTDIKVPNFDDVRCKSTVDPHSKPTKNYEARYMISYLNNGVLLMLTAYMTKHMIRGAVSSLGPAADALAAASVEINIGAIPEGKSVTFKWRGKPIFVKHRSTDDIAKESAVDISTLRDPQHDSERTNDPKWLVVIGVCTHLGCVPIADAGDYGGYYCPCHGSHYDGSGRIRKGPAPLNLEVPNHSFPDADTLVVG